MSEKIPVPETNDTSAESEAPIQKILPEQTRDSQIQLSEFVASQAAEVEPSLHELMGSRREEYFDGLEQRFSPVARISVQNMRSIQDNALFAYEHGNKAQHVLWVVGRDLITYKAVPNDNWQELSKNPDTLSQTNKLLLSAYQNAQDFLSLEDKANGIVIESSNSFGMEQGNHLGIRVSYEHRAKPLFDAIKSGDEKKIQEEKLFLTGEFVHELVHRHYQDGLSFAVSVPMETQAHAVQLLFEPRHNKFLNRQFENSLRVAREKGQDKLEGYDKAQFLAVALVADKLAANNPKIAQLLKDKPNFAEHSWEEIAANVSEDDVSFLQETALKDFLSKDDSLLTKEAERLAA